MEPSTAGPIHEGVVEREDKVNGLDFLVDVGSGLQDRQAPWRPRLKVRPQLIVVPSLLLSDERLVLFRRFARKSLEEDVVAQVNFLQMREMGLVSVLAQDADAEHRLGGDDGCKSRIQLGRI